MNELHLFAGAGGGILGSQLLGHRTICAVEIEEYPRNILLQRQRDGFLPWFPVWDDIRSFDGKPWRGLVDIVSGGFPCQDISSAGRGAGIKGARSGLWGEMARVVCEVRPKFVFVENSPMLTSRGLYRVLGDLAEMGYDARWCVLGADNVGAPHRRKRIWILAYSNTNVCGCLHEQVEIDTTEANYHAQCKSGTALRENAGENVANPNSERRFSRNSRRQDAMDVNPSGKEWLQNQEGIHYGEIKATEGREDVGNSPGKGLEGWENGTTFTTEKSWASNSWTTGCHRPDWWRQDPAEIPDFGSSNTQGEEAYKWPVESRVGRVANGVANRVDRLKAIGNGQVPAVAATAFFILSEGLL